MSDLREAAAALCDAIDHAVIPHADGGYGVLNAWDGLKRALALPATGEAVYVVHHEGCADEPGPAPCPIEHGNVEVQAVAFTGEADARYMRDQFWPGGTVEKYSLAPPAQAGREARGCSVAFCADHMDVEIQPSAFCPSCLANGTFADGVKWGREGARFEKPAVREAVCPKCKLVLPARLVFNAGSGAARPCPDKAHEPPLAGRETSLMAALLAVDAAHIDRACAEFGLLAESKLLYALHDAFAASRGGKGDESCYVVGCKLGPGKHIHGDGNTKASRGGSWK